MTLSFNIYISATQRTLKTKNKYVPIGIASKTIMKINYFKHIYTLKTGIYSRDIDAFAHLGLEHGNNYSQLSICRSKWETIAKQFLCFDLFQQQKKNPLTHFYDFQKEKKKNIERD